MKKKFWCIFTGSPLVKQVAEKYNLDKKTAKTLINSARREDTTLNDDNISVDQLISSDAFKKVFQKFAQDRVDTVDALLAPLPERKKTVEKTVKELNSIYSSEFDEERVEELMDMYELTKQRVKRSKLSARHIADLMKNFKKSERLQFVGDWVCWYTSRVITYAMTDANYANSHRIPTLGNRKEYFTDSNAFAAVRAEVQRTLRYRAKNLEKKGDANSLELAKELRSLLYRDDAGNLIKDNFRNLDTLYALFGGNLFREEGVHFDMEGTPTSTNIRSDNATRTENDDAVADEDSDSTNEEISHSSFSSDDTSKSASSKIADSLKRILYNMTEYGSDGNIKEDKFGYGFQQPLDVPKAVNKLLSIVQGCTNYEEIVAALKQRSQRLPWINSILNAIDTSTETDDTGALTSQSRKEELQAQLFRSLDLVFTDLQGSFKTIHKGGCLSFQNFSTNANNKAEKTLRGVRYAFNDLSELGISKNGKLDVSTISEKIGETNSLLSELQNIRKEISRTQSAEGQVAKKQIDGITEKFRKFIEDNLGIKVSAETINDFLASTRPAGKMTKDNRLKFYDAQLQKVAGEIRLVQSLLNNLKDYASEDELASVNPFFIRFGDAGYSEAAPINRFYGIIIDDLTKDSAGSQESFAYNRVAKNKRYSYSLPTTAQKILRKLQHPDLEKRRRYIMQKYGNDPWFLMPNSTAAEPHFYSPILEDLYYNNIDSERLYSEKPFFCDTEYMSQSDLEYSLSILTDYFFPTTARTTKAKYRLAISGDKKRYSLVSLPRYSDRNPQSDDYYKDVITNHARNAFAQEMWRAIRVIDFAVKGKKSSPRINKYDIKVTNDKDAKSTAIREVIKKIKNKEKVTAKDVVVDGKYIFSGSGASFYFNKFIVDAIELAAKTPDGATIEDDGQIALINLGDYVVDRLFNRSTKTKSIDIVGADIIPYFNRAFSDQMETFKQHFLTTLNDIGMLEEVTITTDEGKANHLKYVYQNLVKWHRNDPQYMAEMYQYGVDVAAQNGLDMNDPKNSHRAPAFAELAMLEDDIEEFVYNNWLAKYGTIQLFDVDLAFYATTPDYQKRAAQRVSAGNYANPDAKLHGETIHDGKFRSITIYSGKVKSNHAENIRTELTKALNRTTDPNRRAIIQAGIDDITGKLKKGYDATDGQSLSCLTSLRKRLVSLGGWTRSDSKALDKRGYVEDPDGTKHYIVTDEAIYQRMLRGEKRIEDLLHVFEQVQKPMVMTFSKVRREGTIVTVPVQNKNSEYALQYLSAFTRWEKNNGEDQHAIMEGVDRFMEETAKLFPGRGIDTANFDSAVKTGLNSKVIDLSQCKNGQEAYEILKKAVLNDEGTDYRDDGVVTEYDMEDYKIVANKPEEFKNTHQPSGSQFNVLIINGIQDSDVATLPNGEHISGKELKQRYLAARAKKTERSIRRFRQELGMDLPYEARIHVLSNMLKNAMATDDRFSPEMRDSVTVVERDGRLQFKTPLDESQLQPAIEAVLMSRIREAHYKLQTNGGIIVQATSWGSADDLSIRFYSSNPEDADGLVPTKTEFGKKHNISGEKLDKEYSKYCETYQTGFAYMEIEITMPGYVRKMLIKKSGSLQAYMNSDGSWNMDKIRQDVPASVFDAICYRVPTEAKYSMMLCKVVRFSKEGSGSVAKYPSEIVLFTGSDFDIDTDTVELRPVENDTDYEVDEELFNLQVAALRMNSSLLESFRDGDFSDVKELSYYLTLLENGYSREELDAMSPRQLKDACDEVEDKDVMEPSTDIILYRQNADAKQMIAVAAVGVTSHAFISLYNDVDPNNSAKNPQVSPENFVTISFSKGNGKNSVNETFHVINDKNPNNVTSMHVGGELETAPGAVILDPSYDMDGRFVGTEISKYVGGSADAAKDAALYRLNINMATLPILVLMHRLGISSDVARLFIKNPIVKRVAATKINLTSFGKITSLDDALGIIRDEVINEAIENKEIKDTDEGLRMFADLAVSDDKELRYSSLLDTIANPSQQSLRDKLMLLIILDQLNNKLELVRNLDSFTRYNSRNTMRGTSFIDRLAKRESIVKLRNNLNSEKPVISLPQNVDTENEMSDTAYDRLAAMFPYIAETVHNEEELEGDIIADFMRTYSPSFFEVARRLDILDKPEEMKRLYAGYKNYLLFVGENRIADFSNEATFRYFTVDFAEHFTAESKKLQKKEEFKDNEFLNNVVPEKVPDGYKEFSVLTTDTLGLRGASLEAFKKDWEALLDNPESRDLAIDAAIHFLARSAAFSRNTPINVMPERIKDAIPNYKKAFADASKVSMTEDRMDLFINLFMRHNPEDKTIVPHFYNSDRAQNAIYKTDSSTSVPQLLIRKKAKASSDVLYTDSESKSIKASKPIICVEGDGEAVLFALLPGEIVPVKIDNEDYYSMPAIPVSPLGIPNHIAEYVGGDLATNPVSMFEPSDDAQAENEQNTGNRQSVDEAGDLAEQPSEGYYGLIYEGTDLVQSGKTGTVIESAPFGSDLVDSSDNKLIQDSVDNNDAYLETRTHIRRIRRLADAMGFNVDSARAASSNNSAAVYNISIVPKEYTENQHEDAMVAAAVIGSLGYKSGTTTVKTYVSPDAESEREFLPNAVEISFKIPAEKKNDFVKAVLANASELPDGASLIVSNNGEVMITQQLNPMDFEESASIMNDTIAEIRSAVGSGTELSVNFCDYTVLNNEAKINILKSARNESIENKRPAKVSGKGQASRSSSWKQVGFEYILDLAVQEEEGKEVEDEIRTLFGESQTPLVSPKSSYESRKLVDSVEGALEDDVRLDIQSMLDDKGMSGGKVSDKVDSLIINTANWIRGHMPSPMIQESLSRTGLTDDSAKSIIKAINEQLEKQNIC